MRDATGGQGEGVHVRDAIRLFVSKYVDPNSRGWSLGK